MDIYLTNTLTRKKEKFAPIKKGEVGIYSCGPTVYWNQHIGHMYAYVQWDVLVRFLRYLGYKVNWVMNITDVGHMENDEDVGEDKMEKGAKREGISVNELAEKYAKQFLKSLKLLNITTPDKLPKATEHIQEQIELAKLIEKNSFTYLTEMGLVYDTSKYPDYAKFANLNLDKLKKSKDVEVDPEKKKPWDFFLWVTGNTNHVMKWPSPWGEGYPGWHIECTAMSTKYLGDRFDIHTGGVDHIPVHHTNELAQGYAAFGKSTANYWLHNSMLTGKGGEKMSKSLGNFLTVQEIVEKGFDPLALRYLFLTSHYRKGLNFTFEALRSSQKGLIGLREQINALRKDKSRHQLSNEKLEKVNMYRKKFEKVLGDDLNVAKALAVLREMLKSNIPSTDKYDLAMSFDEVLGLNLRKESKVLELPKEIKDLLKKREELREEGKFKSADELRKKIEKAGYSIEDTPKGVRIKLIHKRKS